MLELRQALKQAVKDLFSVDIEPELTRPEEQFGDYSSNVAMQLATKIGKQPREIAEALAAKIQNAELIAKTEVASPGFINFWLSDNALLNNLERQPAKTYKGQEILVEFGDPNPFKEMHIGHLYSYIVGESICRLFAAAGAEVKRLSYHGDVGLHVAQAIYGLLELGEGASLGGSYAYGAEKYASYPTAKDRIEAINKAIYEVNDPEINELHQTGVKQSFEYFDKILDLLSISNDRRYLESEVTALGLQLVKDNIGKVFQESQGAIVYDGEKAGLHTRVFITSKGLPTYETKDLGLVELKNRDYPGASKSIVITANEQSEYFKVVLAALSEINPKLASMTTHMSHGFLSLTTGKMSSRTGDVLKAEDVLARTKLAISNSFQEIDTETRDQTMLAAVKYAFLKHRIGSDIVYNPKESVTTEGNSGPYLQYAYVRARSILQKSSNKASGSDENLQADERSLARKIGEYAEVVEQATSELLPSHICTYLYELAQTFNRFYEENRILGDERQDLRLRLVEAYTKVLKNGLSLLNISAPEKM